MATFAELGVTVQRAVQNEAISLQSAEATGETMETVLLTLTLPRPAAVRATFSKEGVGKKLLKLFEKELQTGDAEFDREVFVSTDTLEATAALLAAKDIRDVILDYVTLAGPIEIDGTCVTAVVPGQGDKDDQNVCRLVAALLR